MSCMYTCTKIQKMKTLPFWQKTYVNNIFLFFYYKEDIRNKYTIKIETKMENLT